MRELFAECQRREQEGYSITLGSAPERTRGAAVFYLKKQLPVVNANTPIGAREVRVVRGGEKGKLFADRHRLLKAAEPPQREKIR